MPVGHQYHHHEDAKPNAGRQHESAKLNIIQMYLQRQLIIMSNFLSSQKIFVPRIRSIQEMQLTNPKKLIEEHTQCKLSQVILTRAVLSEWRIR